MFEQVPKVNFFKHGLHNYRKKMMLFVQLSFVQKSFLFLNIDLIFDIESTLKL